jgi:RNase H-like domain found in reverse transcriptase/Reverse transcriptase (RNA-dependent DNA polymerase)/Integrase zinc binding domain
MNLFSELLDRLSINDHIQNIDLSDNSDRLKMAPPVAPAAAPRAVNWDLFKLKLDNIRPYDGDSSTLNKFIHRCENLLTTYSIYEDADLNKHVFECIQEKLIGKAEGMVGNRLELNNWVSLKEALIQCFSDRRDVDCLIQELTRIRPLKFEDMISFGTRLQLLRSNVVQRINNDIDLSQQDKLCQINHCDKTALNTYIAGCSGVLKNNMHLKKPESLEDAIAYVGEFENFGRLYDHSNDRRNQFSNYNSFNKSSNFKSSPNFFHQNWVQNQYQDNYQRPRFPSRPINIQPQPQPPQKYFTNSQVFGTPRNVFKPNQIPSHKLPKQEPMSTTSKNPTLYTQNGFNSFNRSNNRFRFNNNNRYFQNNGQKPNFTFEELHSSNYNNNENNDFYEQNIENLEYVDDYLEHGENPNFLSQAAKNKSDIAEINLSTNPLPYIEIQYPKIKLLVDTGSTKNMLRPSIAEQFFPDCIYHSDVDIITSLVRQRVQFQAEIPAFREFQSNNHINFILYDFHHFFDGIIGLADLIKMQLNIDFTNKRLISDRVSIPIKFRQPSDIQFQFSVGPFEKLLRSLPVNIEEGEILIKETRIGELFIPETLSVARHGLAVVEIVNQTNKTLTTTLNEPICVDPFVSCEYEIYNFNYFDKTLKLESCEKSIIDDLIRTEHMNSEEKKSMFKLCSQFLDIFQKPGDPLTFTSNVKHVIKTNDEIPVHVKSYRYPYIHKTEVKKQIYEMLEKGIIRASCSPWSSPIWIVGKKMDASGQQKWRLVVDYRKLNEKTISDRYPIPNINDILDKLGRAQYFSTIDLASGFHQIEMDQCSIEKTAFSVDNGHWEFLRMPAGLRNSPATFQRAMDEILKDIQNKICMVYMDDIIVFSTSLQEHIQNLKLVFSKLREARLKIQIDKCEFFRKEVEFLGHVVTPHGIKPNPNKIKAIKNFPIPKTHKQIKSFLGLLGYYRKFIKDFAKITKPMTTCLKKGQKVEHTKSFIECFNVCKNLLTSEPILAYPDFSKTFELMTDASNYAIGAVLMQGGHPISYASRTLNSAETNYSTIEKELLAVVWGCKYFRPYIFGRQFLILTDHKPLQWMFSLKEPNSRLVRWRLKLEEFDYKIRYRKGKNNQVADALSRINPDIDLNAFETDSLDVNIDDIDSIIQKELQEINDLPNLTEDVISEVLDMPKINILSNHLLTSPNQDNESSNQETVHTSLENPTLIIPISDRPLNSYKNQILLTISDTNELRTKKEQIFNNTRVYIIFPQRNLEQGIVKFIKEFTDPQRTYALFFRDPLKPETFVTLVQNIFKNSSFKFVHCPKIVDDVLTCEEQQGKIEYYHIYKQGHRGINEVKASLSSRYYWPNMGKDIENYINNCEICQKNRYDRSPPVVKFNLTPTASKPFDHIHIDVFRISNHPYLTIIDSFSRYGQAYPISSVSGVSVVAGLLNYITHHGLPFKITADLGTEFKNSDLEDFCKLHKIELHFITSKNSNSNSPVERFHSTLIEHFRCLRATSADLTADQLMKYAILTYNNSIHSVTKYTPFEIVKGHINNTDPFDLNDHHVLSHYVQNHKEASTQLYNKIRERNAEIKEKNINKVNENRSDPLDYSNQNIAYVRTKLRDKKLPKFKKTEIVNDKGILLETNKGTYHKSIIRKPKNNFGILLQIPEDNEVVDDPDIILDPDNAENRM